MFGMIVLSSFGFDKVQFTDTSSWATTPDHHVGATVLNCRPKISRIHLLIGFSPHVHSAIRSKNIVFAFIHEYQVLLEWKIFPSVIACKLQSQVFILLANKGFLWCNSTISPISSKDSSNGPGVTFIIYTQFILKCFSTMWRSFGALCLHWCLTIHFSWRSLNNFFGNFYLRLSIFIIHNNKTSQLNCSMAVHLKINY